MRIVVAFFSVFLALAGYAETTDDAKRLYHDYQDAIYQIRIIEKGSGNKAAIGSGFQISSDGLLVSNFHVVSEAVSKPDRYLIESLSSKGQRTHLEILTLDVVHDLVILKQAEAGSSWLNLQEGDLEKGARIFSLGNPHDLGMTVVEGTYNGIVDHSLYERVLISGSLNPGMSGGPSINRKGMVVGINVSTAGNQISFLVPVVHLRNLYQSVDGVVSSRVNWEALIEHQLVQNQQRVVDELLQSPWATTPLGDVQVPSEIADYVKCWGDTEAEDEQLYKVIHRTCNVDEAIYLAQYFSSGTFRLQYQWLETQSLNRFQFYSQMQDSFYLTEANNAYRENVTPYECKSEFVEAGGQPWKIRWCARRYKRFPLLLDVSFSLASLADNRKGMLMNFAMAGIDQANAKRVTERFLESIQWKSL